MTEKKLVELLRYVGYNIMDFRTENFMESLASFLIANGVTVQRWIPVKEEAKEPVPCSECKHRMWSDHYAECSKGHKGIVRPDDTCPYGERRSDGR